MTTKKPSSDKKIVHPTQIVYFKKKDYSHEKSSLSLQTKLSNLPPKKETDYNVEDIEALQKVTKDILLHYHLNKPTLNYINKMQENVKQKLKKQIEKIGNLENQFQTKKLRTLIKNPITEIIKGTPSSIFEVFSSAFIDKFAKTPITLAAGVAFSRMLHYRSVKNSNIEVGYNIDDIDFINILGQSAYQDIINCTKDLNDLYNQIIKYETKINTIVNTFSLEKEDYSGGMLIRRIKFLDNLIKYPQNIKHSELTLQTIIEKNKEYVFYDVLYGDAKRKLKNKIDGIDSLGNTLIDLIKEKYENYENTDRMYKGVTSFHECQYKSHLSE